MRCRFNSSLQSFQTTEKTEKYAAAENVDGDRHMYVNNVPRVALDSGAARIQTRDLSIASPAS